MDRRTLIITTSVLIGLNSAILTDYLGINLPLIRQVFGFVALTFLPGCLLLKVLRTRLENTSERIFMSVALSISIVMFMGIFANFIYPFIGIKHPITLKPLLITFDLIVIFLLIVQQKRSLPIHESWKFKVPKITKWDLFFLFLPFASVLSAYLFSFYGDNRGLLALYFVISLTPGVFVKAKNFNRTLAIWSMAISLMWSTVFGMSWNYIWGFDINGEYYYANVVLAKGIWDISTFYQYNTVASVNILAPVYSLILNVSVIKIFKIIYPLVFSLVPIILLKAYERLLGREVLAEFSVLFFMFQFTFFTEMMALARQMIAEVYLALLVYALIKRINSLLLLIFGMSLIVSHYGIAYLFMFALLSVGLIRVIKNDTKLDIYYVVIFWIFTLLWYQYVGGGVQFYNLVNIGHSTLIMLNDILNPKYSQGFAIIASNTTPVKQITKWINIFAQGLISIGVMWAMYSIVYNINNIIIIGKQKREYIEFYVLSFVFFAYDVEGVILPFFANRLNATRLYQITLFFLSPYLVIGTISMYKIIHKIFHISGARFKIPNLNINYGTKALAVFLIAYFLFNSGIMLVLLNDPKPPMWLEKADGPTWSSAEIYGGKWITKYRDENMHIYSDQYRALIFLGLIGQPISDVSFRGGEKTFNLPKKDFYIYFGLVEVTKKKVPVLRQIGSLSEMNYLSIYDPSIFKSLLQSQKIYSSNEVWIYKA